MNRKYSPEMRERALRMLAETRPSHPTMMSAVRHVAGLLGMSPETLRLWQRRYEVDAGVKPGLTTDAAAEIKRLVERARVAGGRIGDTDEYPFMYQRQFDDPDGYHYSPFWMKPEVEPVS
ncbi:MAG: transposase [Microthrixaceae bacterium]|nr:transposase [Microthrixaceae bacterium]